MNVEGWRFNLRKCFTSTYLSHWLTLLSLTLQFVAGRRNLQFLLEVIALYLRIFPCWRSTPTWKLWKLWSSAALCGLCPRVSWYLGEVNTFRRVCHNLRLPAEKEFFPCLLWDSSFVCSVTTRPGHLNFWGLNDLSRNSIGFLVIALKAKPWIPCIGGGCSSTCWWRLCFNKCFRTVGCLVRTWKCQEINSIPRDIELMYKL